MPVARFIPGPPLLALPANGRALFTSVHPPPTFTQRTMADSFLGSINLFGSDDSDESGGYSDGTPKMALDAHSDDDITRPERPIEGDGNPVYESDDGESSADEVDPKKLFRNASLDDLRWYYRNGPFGSTLCDKPVRDAFKYGYTIEDNDEFAEKFAAIDSEYRYAQPKARRDGFALMWFRLRDAASEHESPRNVKEVAEVKTLTVDDMTTTMPTGFDEKLPDGYDSTDVTITDHGIVMSRKVDDIDRFDKPVGYLYDLADKHATTDDGIADSPVFIHHERVHHSAWREAVDGDVDDETWGRWEGDSVLQPVANLLRAVNKGNWAVMQNLWRHSAPLHKMSMPEGADDEEYDKAEHIMQNINSKSAVTEPPNFELSVVDSESDAEPRDPYDVLFDQICAATEFTRSVLFGTQTGTVTGSETDIKNYFNKVQTLRNTRFEADFMAIAQMYADWGLIDDPEHSVSWGPMFKLDRIKQAEAMRNQVNLVGQGVSNYVLSADEARSLLDAEWADWTDMSLDDSLTESQLDQLDRINVGRTYATGGSEEAEVEGTPRSGQNGGGRDGRNNTGAA